MNTEKILSLWKEWNVTKNSDEDSLGEIHEILKIVSGEEIRRFVRLISIPRTPSETELLKKQNLSDEDIKAYYEKAVNNLIAILEINQSLGAKSSVLTIHDYKILPKRDKMGYDVYIMTERLPTLESYLKTNKLSEEQIIKLASDISEAAYNCHQKNICHGNINPENIFVTPSGRFKLGNVGIGAFLSSKIIKNASIINEEYASPEVIKENRFTPAADIYSIGSVLFRLTNGKAPFLPSKPTLTTFDRKNALGQKLNGQEIPFPQCKSKVLSAVIIKACAFDPKSRFSSALQLKKAFNTYPSKVSKEDAIVPIFINGVRQYESKQAVSPSYVPNNIKETARYATIEPQGEQIVHEAQRIPNAVSYTPNISNDDEQNNDTSKSKKTITAIIIAILVITSILAVFVIVKSSKGSKNDESSPAEESSSEQNEDKPSDDTLDDVSENTSTNDSNDVSHNVSDDTSNDISEDTSNDVSSDTSNDISGDTSNDISGETSDDISEDTSNDTSGDFNKEDIKDAFNSFVDKIFPLF